MSFSLHSFAAHRRENSRTIAQFQTNIDKLNTDKRILFPQANFVYNVYGMTVLR